MKKNSIVICICFAILIGGCSKDSTESNKNTSGYGSNSSINQDISSLIDSQYGNSGLPSSENNTQTSGNSSQVSSNSAVTIIPPNDLSHDTNASNNVRIFGLWETDKGQYSIVRLNQSMNILFLDYSLMKQYPLCNKPNCDHGGSYCNSFLGGGLDTGFMFVYNNTLYILYNNELISMNPDGTNRSVVLKVPDKYKANSLIYADHQFIIEASVYTAPKEGEQHSHPKWIFLKINLDKKEINELGSWEIPEENTNNEINESLLGTYNGYAYYRRAQAGEPLASATQESYDKSLNTAKNGIVKINIQNGTRDNVLTDTYAKEVDYLQLLGNCIYYHSRQDKAMYEINLNNNSNKAVINNLNGYCGSTTILDGKLIYYIYYNESDFGKSNPRKPEKRYFDLKTGSQNQVKNTTNNNEVFIYGIYQDDYLIKIDDKDQKMQVGWISRQDFWDGKYDRIKKVFSFNLKEAKNLFRGSRA